MPERSWADNPELAAQAAELREINRQAKQNGKAVAEPTSLKLPDPAFVRERLSLAFWQQRPLPPVDPLLGEFVTTTSRIMLVGPTGGGKTSISMAIGFAIADGVDFLHWRGSGRERRVLYIDGEMSGCLFKARLADAERRHGAQPETFFAFSREDFDDMPPLDTSEGQQYIDHIIDALGGISAIFLDNIQALTIGELREPESWRKVIPWTRDLTKRRIGQIWEHHTGLAEDHGYGDKTREWGLDTVALMETAARPGADIAFGLKFPKARERTPDNRADFEPTIITLADDRWSSERGEHVRKLEAKDRALELLQDAIVRDGVIPPASEHIPPGTRCVAEKLWREYCDRGCLSTDTPDAARMAFNRAARKLINAGKVGKWEAWVWIIR